MTEEVSIFLQIVFHRGYLRVDCGTVRLTDSRNHKFFKTCTEESRFLLEIVKK